MLVSKKKLHIYRKNNYLNCYKTVVFFLQITLTFVNETTTGVCD